MKNIHKLAAIDIGSNAVRLLITSIRINKSETEFKKISLVRVPLRLQFLVDYPLITNYGGKFQITIA